MRISTIGSIILFSMATLAHANEQGQISVCRTPGITELMDNKAVDIPSTGTYAGGCNKDGENCRPIFIKVLSSAILKPGKSSCALLPAEITQSDGKALKKGTQLLPQWDVPGFTAKVTVTQDFK